MRKVLVVYSHEDLIFTDKLVADLDLSDLDVGLDQRILKPGDSLLEIFNELASADFLVPILSENSVNSRWVQKELRVAIVKEVEEAAFKVVPVVKPGEDWERLRSLIPPDLKEALRDKYAARFDIKERTEALKQLLRALSPDKSLKGLYEKIHSPNADNPFRRVRTEYFENAHVLARSFAEPESVSYDLIVDVKPTIIEGGRGSGKTMILRSLQALVSVYRSGKTSFKEARLPYFGVYCRLTRGGFATASGSILNYVPEDLAAELFFTELILQQAQCLIEELLRCSLGHVLEANANQERNIALRLLDCIRPERAAEGSPIDFQALKREIQLELRRVREHLKRKIAGENPNYTGVFLHRDELESICSIVLDSLPELSAGTIYFLLDEYENLLPFQKIVVNTLIKWARKGVFTVKLATKKTGFEDPQTLEQQEIEEAHDYGLVDLDYDIRNPSHRHFYRALLTKVCEKILTNEKFERHDIKTILQNKPEYDGLTLSAVEKEVAAMVTEQGKNWARLTGREKSEFFKRLRTTAIYRVLQTRQKRGEGGKQFAGFRDLVLLSSGIIRYFLELCCMSYYFATRDGLDVKGGKPIETRHQTEAAYALSSYYLDNIRKNIVGDGARIQKLVIDLGSIFRQKLLKHLSEPEAARLSIVDPERLDEPLMAEVKQLLNTAEMHSVFQVSGALGGIRPKNIREVQPREYLLNRIYAPVLGFSPYLRWRTKFTAGEIRDMLDPDQRQLAKGELIRRVSGINDYGPSTSEQLTLFEKRPGNQ